MFFSKLNASKNDKVNIFLLYIIDIRSVSTSGLSESKQEKQNEMRNVRIYLINCAPSKQNRGKQPTGNAMIKDKNQHPGIGICYFDSN